MMDNIFSRLSPTLKMRVFGLLKVPLLFATGAKVPHLCDKECRIEIPFRKIVKNHVGSMYFGALAIGAEASVGLLAVQAIEKRSLKASFLFKSFQIEFLKRAEGPTTFVCKEGQRVNETLEETIRTGERCTKTLSGEALCRGEVVARFSLDLSLKVRPH